MIIVIPFDASFFSSYTIFKAVLLSKPLVGSSNKIKLGSVINSYPIHVLFRSPPEMLFRTNPPILVSLQDYKLSLSINPCAFFSISYWGKFVLKDAAKQKLSKGVIVSISISSYITNAPSLPKSPLCTWTPLHLTSPVTNVFLFNSNL